MTETSPKLGLPYIQPAQAQKHVTHNEAVRALDTLVQLRIAEFGSETAPETPAQGETHALGPAPGGAWTGQSGKLATWDGMAWQFLRPQEGWLAWDTAAARLRIHVGGDWIHPALADEEFARLGIATAADDTNRLAVAADAVLLTHAGGDHRLKVNKATETDTASLLFQSGWTGHAEMGLNGDTGFSLKVSADGGSWTQVMRADPAVLQVDVPITGVAVQSSSTDTTVGRLMRADYGYGPGNILGAVSQSVGVPTGAVIEHGSNANGEYVRFADGTQICTTSKTSSGSATTNWIFPATFSSAPRVSVQTNSGEPRFGNHHSTTSTGVNFDSWDVTGARDAQSCDLIAIGRWF